MKAGTTTIHQIVNPSKFQKIQDDISLATGLAVITVDYKGIPLTVHSNCSEFCKRIRASDKYRAYCEKCDSRGGVEAARIRKPYIYLCHAGLVDFAIPIIVDNLYLGAFMAGQVILDKEDSDNQLEHILFETVKAADLALDNEIQQYYTLLPVMSIEKITALANMLLHIGNYCIEQAVLKATIAKLTTKKQPSEIYKKPEHSINAQNSSEALNYNSIKKHHKILQPAFTYIDQHLEEKISLSKMAAICNISTSYFSKLFARENLGNLSDYVNRIKMDSAKELLLKTDLPVRSIADNLGFDDCGYFIKIFKRETGTTPAEFRKESSAYGKQY